MGDFWNINEIIEPIKTLPPIKFWGTISYVSIMSLLAAGISPILPGLAVALIFVGLQLATKQSQITYYSFLAAILFMPIVAKHPALTGDHPQSPQPPVKSQVQQQPTQPPPQPIQGDPLDPRVLMKIPHQIKTPELLALHRRIVTINQKPNRKWFRRKKP